LVLRHSEGSRVGRPSGWEPSGYPQDATVEPVVVYAALVWEDDDMPVDQGESSSGVALPTVTVRGQAVIRAESDEAMLWIMVSALEDSPGAALADVARRGDAIVRMLDELGVAKSDRSTTGVRVQERV
jgi:uncharacterized protein YggE